MEETLPKSGKKVYNDREQEDEQNGVLSFQQSLISMGNPPLPLSMPSTTHHAITPAVLLPIANSSLRVFLYQGSPQPSSSKTVVKKSSTVATTNLQNSPSLYSGSSQEQSCRICRFNSKSEELISCPCKCSGSVGFVHLTCLRRWIRFKRNYRCEICKDVYNLSQEPRDYWKLFWNFFQAKYFGRIMRHILNITAVTPFVYFSISQMMQTMETITEENAVKLLFIGPAMLLATSVYFFLYFDWAITCLIQIQRIFARWWSFGDQDDDNDYLLENSSSFDDFLNFNF